jgi:hypothetical protein
MAKVVADTGGKWDLVGINFEEKKEVIEFYLKRNPIDMTVLTDTFGNASCKLGVTGTLPRTFVVGPDGIVRAIIKEEGPDFDKVLRAAMAQ